MYRSSMNALYPKYAPDSTRASNQYQLTATAVPRKARRMPV